MSTVKGKSKLCSTSVNGISIESVGGVPFYDRYVEFERLLQKYVADSRYMDSFAEPLFNGTGGTIDWYIPAQYVGVTRLEELKGTQDYEEAVRQKNVCIQYLKRQMVDMSDHDRQYFDCLTKYADSDISDFTTFYGNGHIFFGVWGIRLNGAKDISMAIRTDIDDSRVHTVTYLMSGKGMFTGVDSTLKRRHGHVLSGARDIPNVIPGEGFEFSSWEPDAPHNKVVESDMTFTAVCTETAVPVEPSAEESPVADTPVEQPVPEETPAFGDAPSDSGNDETGKGFGTGASGGFFGRNGGCLNWLIGILGALLLIFLILLLLKTCSPVFGTGDTFIITDEKVPAQPSLPPPVVEGNLEKEKVTTEKEVDYEAVRSLIQEYQERIEDLSRMLPENEKEKE